MSQQREIIRRGLQELSNASESRRNCWVTFEANGKEHWLQCTPTQINMDWPFSSPPAESDRLKECFASGRTIKIDAWDIDSYVTFTPTVRDVDSLIVSIDSTFQDLYGLGAEYTLKYKIEDGLQGAAPRAQSGIGTGQPDGSGDFARPESFRGCSRSGVFPPVRITELGFLAAMRKLSSTEKAGLALCVALILGGTALLVHPIEGYINHPSDTGGSLPRTDTHEVMTKPKSRFYGVIAISLGIGIGWLALYRAKD